MEISAEERRLVHDAMKKLMENEQCVTTEGIALFVKTKHGRDIDMDTIADIQREQTNNVVRRLKR